MLPVHGPNSHSGSFMSLFGQMLLIPFTVFAQGMELLVKAVRGIEGATSAGMGLMMGGAAPVAGPHPALILPSANPVSATNFGNAIDVDNSEVLETTDKEKTTMDRD